jgi:protein-S-isoprenylcysteine O-methyltransferase Ste14
MEMLTLAVILLCYVSLIVELTWLHVPSVASSRNIWRASESLVSVYSESFKKRFEYSKLEKLIRYFAPLAAIYAVFAFPLLVTLTDIIPGGFFVYQPSQPHILIAIILMILGRVVALLSVLTLRRGIRREEGASRLQTNGVFAWSRNPGLVGMHILLLGFWIVMPSLVFAAGIFVYVFYMDAKVKMEEDFLMNRFSEGFEKYCSDTRRYL